MAVYINGNKIADFKGDVYLQGENVVANFKDGSPKGVAETYEDLPTLGDTGVYVVLADGHWYFWDGESWLDGGVYQSTQTLARSVSYDDQESAIEEYNVQNAIDWLANNLRSLNASRISVLNEFVASTNVQDAINELYFDTENLNVHVNDEVDRLENAQNKINTDVSVRLNALEGAVYEPILSEQAFTERITAEGAETIDGAYALVNKIGGKSLKVNQLIGNIPQTQTINGVTFTNNGNGSITVNGTATSDTNILLQSGIPIKAGYKYYLCGCALGGSLNTYYIQDSWLGRIDVGNGFIGDFSNDDKNISIRLFVKSGVTLNNLIFRPQLFHLTAMGLDSITTVAQFKAIYGDNYYASGDYILNSNATKLNSYNSNWFTGVNWEKGKKYSSDGVTLINENRSNACTDFIKVLPNTQYCFSIDVASVNDFVYLYYDADKNFISLNNFAKNVAFTTPTNCEYLRVYTGYVTGGSPISTECMLNIGSSVLPYVVHDSNTFNIPAFNQYGINDTICNYIDFERKKKVTMVRRAKLKDLNWSSNTAGAYYTTSLASTIKINYNNPNMLCNKYITHSWSGRTNGDIAMDGSGNITILDNNFSSLSDFVASLTDNDYLYYELATPIEENITITNDKYIAFSQGRESFDSDVALVTSIIYRGGK